MKALRGLAVLLLGVAGCAGQSADEGCDDMRVLDQQYNRPEHWGATKNYEGPWALNQERIVLIKPPYKAIGRGKTYYCVPQAQSILLVSSIQDISNPADAFAFRWVLKLGNGGGASRVVMDALNTQQVSVAAENIEVAIMVETASPTPGFGGGLPTGTWHGTVAISDGNVSSGQATYTSTYVVGPGATRTYPVPAMATSFRLAGTDNNTSPFVAAFSIEGLQPLIQTSWKGNGFSKYNGDFVPIPGGTRSVILSNSGLDSIYAVIQWGLDL